MKTSALLLLTLILAAPGLLSAAVFKTAEVTRVLNDVRVVQGESNSATAKIGDVITGDTAVATGVSSRAELKFPDQTLTRLGANTLFRLEEGTRDIDLKQGVLLLQVPKQLGGARVRTAAVTAAVTGTTILVEYDPNGYIKIIVIEGEIDLYMNDKPSNFTTIKAGDMIIMKPDAKAFPLPVQVDLKRLIKTSKLLNPDEFGPIGNDKQIADALNEQGDLKNKGELLNTAFMLPGTGTRVTFTNEVRRELLRFQDPPRDTTRNPRSDNNGNSGSGGSNPNSPSGPRPFIPGTTYISDNSSIVTNPHITAYNSLVDVDVTSQGSYYRASQDGTVGSAIFGLPSSPSPLDSLVASSGLWSAFHFENLVIVGNPAVNAVGSRNLILASNLGIELIYNQYNIGEIAQEGGPPTGSGQFNLTNLDGLLLTSSQGPITFNGTFEITGSNQDVLLQTYGQNGDISINSNFSGYTHVNVPDGSFNAAASRDILFSGGGIRASTVNLNAKRDINLSNNTDIAARNNINIIAQRSFTISNSSQLRTLGEVIDPLQIYVAARGGDLSVLDSDISADNVNLESTLNNIVLTNSNISADVIRARAMGPNGQLLINGATFNAYSALKLYAEGSNGQVRFTGIDSYLNGPSSIIAAKTVTIDQNTKVIVSNPSGLRVHTDNRNFSNNGGSPNFGAFTDGEAPINVPNNNFSPRPGY
jgi:hypothetical protein